MKSAKGNAQGRAHEGSKEILVLSLEPWTMCDLLPATECGNTQSTGAEYSQGLGHMLAVSLTCNPQPLPEGS